MDDTRLILGAMSGTSADGIDTALVKISGKGSSMKARLLVHHHDPYPQALRESLFALRMTGQTSLAELARLGREISLAYIRAASEILRIADRRADELAACAIHGQTIYHRPPHTIQWVDPSLVAYEVGCPVVSDFRRADCAAGGEGAPLVPFADHLLFGSDEKNRVILNLGGIANITWLPAGRDSQKAIAFDTGPANCITDHLCRKHLPDGPGFDESGKLAASGRPDWKCVELLMDQEYFHRTPPKSTDTPGMLGIWEKIREGGKPGYLADELATACAWSARAVGWALSGRMFIPGRVDEVYFAGGGGRNHTLISMLQRELDRSGTPAKVLLLPVDALGIPAQAREAVAFALLGAATLDGVCGNLHRATGARRPVILGSITPRP